MKTKTKRNITQKEKTNYPLSSHSRVPPLLNHKKSGTLVLDLKRVVFWYLFFKIGVTVKKKA